MSGDKPAEPTLSPLPSIIFLKLTTSRVQTAALYWGSRSFAKPNILPDDIFFPVSS